MRQIRLFALALISFVATIIGSFLSPGTFLHRALSVATCTVFSFNSTLCAANLVGWGDRVVAANPPAVVAQSNACGSGTVTQPTMQRGKDGTMYQVYYDFRRGKETVNSAACGREYWISPNSKHRLYGIRFVYLVNGQRNRVVPTLYYETVSGGLKVYDNNVAAARLSNPFSPDLGIASNPNPTRPQVSKPNSSQSAQSRSRPQVDTPSQNPNSSNHSSRPKQSLATRTITFKSPSAKQLSSDTFELDLVSDAGCNFTTIVRQKGAQVYQESIKFTPSSVEVCGLPPLTARLQPDGKQIEVQIDGSPELLILEKINDNSMKAIYKDRLKTTDLGVIPIQREGKKGLNLTKAANKDIKKNCDLARSACNWLGYASGSASLLEFAGAAAGLSLVPPFAAVFAGAMAVSAVAGLGCWFMFGGFPPLSFKGSEIVEGLSTGYGYASGFGGLIDGLSGITEWQDKKLRCIRNYLSDNTPIKFNACDQADGSTGSEQRRKDCDGDDDPKPKPQKTGNSYGDPHMITFDGFKYSFQTVGEFTLVKSTNGNFEVQARQGAISNSVSMNTAVAMKIGNIRVALYAKNPPDSDTSTPLRVDGKPTKLENGTLELPGGGKIQGNSSYYLVTAPTGEQVGVNLGNGRMDIKPYISAQSGRYIGLLGNANGNPADDLQTRGGKVIPSKENSTYGQVSQALRNLLPVPAPLNQAEKLFFDVVYKEFGDSWRISQAESLFDYPPGKDTGTFTNRSFPNSYLSLNSLLPPQIRKAEEICRQAGVESELMDGCIFDVGQTGDASFAESAANALLDTAKDRLLQELTNKIPVPSLPVPVRIPGIRF